MMNKRRAVFLDHPSLDLGDLDLSGLRDCFSELQLFEQTTPQNLLERLQGAQVAISNKVPLSAEILAACPELKLILVSATGRRWNSWRKCCCTRPMSMSDMPEAKPNQT